MTDDKRLQDIRERIERAKTYTSEESAGPSYWPSLYAKDVQWLLEHLKFVEGILEAKSEHAAGLLEPVDWETE